MKNMKDLRLESGLKVKKIATELNISRTQFYNLELGKYKLSEDKILKLAQLYQKKYSEIIEAEKYPN